MNNISAIINTDGEVIASTDFGSEREFDFKVLNLVDHDILKEFFIKKTIMEAVRERHKTSNGSNGITTVEILNLFKWEELEDYVIELEKIRAINKKQGINLEMYFLPKKVRR
jgi:hypothetical protein